MTFAGFWVDGAVRKPEERHADEEHEVLVKTKSNSRVPFLETFSDVTDEYYWLDTTPRESLTPEELFSVLKIMWTELEYIKLHAGNSWVFGEGAIIETPINWGNLTQYPPPTEPQWICVTRENVAQYLFSECRFRNSTAHEWRTGVLCGWDDQDCCCLVNSLYVEEIPIMSWKYVEVAQ